MKTHKETYPEQYSHPMCGKRVQAVHKGKVLADGTVTRVMGTKFVPLAEIDTAKKGTAYSLRSLVEVS